MRKARIVLPLLLSAALAAGCAGRAGDSRAEQPGGGAQQEQPQQNQQGQQPQPSPGQGQTPTKTPGEAAKPPVDPIQATVAGMTLEQKLGQMIIAGIDGTTMDEQTKSLIADDAVGGFILYKPNIESAEQTVQLLNAMKEANRGNPAPLLFSVDQEGGSVNRMPDTFVAVPPNRDIAKSGDSDKARAIGEAIGAEVRALGFNVDFAPVLDVDSNPNNPVIGNRSFGPTASVVGSFGVAEMSGLREGRVVPVVKHFPGHGDTSVDSHLELPVVNKTKDQLRKLELVPFAQAIEAKADAVMIAHILLPQLDPDHPSSMSPQLITGLLRGEMGFDGVVITDDMTMGAILKHYDLGEAAVQAVSAGADIVLVAHEYAQAKQAIEALEQAVKAGTLGEDAVDRSVSRIIALKQRYKLSDGATAPVDPEPINAALRKAIGK